MTDLMTERGREARSRVLHALRHDSAFWIAFTLLIVALGPYFLPALSQDQREGWALRYADVLAYAAALIAVLVGLTRIPDSRERGFWRLIAFAVAAVLFGETLRFFVSDEIWGPGWELTVQAIFLCFYLGIALALEASRSYSEREGMRRLIWLRTIGLGMLLFGVLMYFENIPTTLGLQGVVSWAPSLFIYSALDVVLFALFVRARGRTADRRWRSILGGIAAVLGALAVVDGAEAVLLIEPLASVKLSLLWDLPWYLPPAILVVVARSRESMPAPAPHAEVGERVTTLGGGPLVAYMLVLPLMHASLYAVGVLDPAFRGPREVLVGMFLVMAGALTLLYQRTVEQQNEAAHEELSISRERYESFLRTTGEGIFLGELIEPVSVVDPVKRQIAQIRSQLRIAEANESFAEMYGHSNPSEMVGRLFVQLPGTQHHPVLQRDFVDSNYEAIGVISKGEDAEGNVRFFRNSISGVVDDGVLLRIWGTQVDITEECLREEEKEKFKDELHHSQKLETIGTLAGGIAHDFNNILAPIVGFVELAAAEIPPENGEVRSYLEHVAKAANRAQDLVKQILMMSRRQKGQKALVRVQDIVGEALRLLRPTLPSTIHINTDVDSGCPPVLADAGQIHQVLMNLCTNARQAIGDRVGNLTVALSWTPGESSPLPCGPAGQITLTVSDDGPGMESDIADRIFEPFFTTKGVGEGTGLGLSVAHGIVTEHGGDLRVDTAPGTGTTFVIRFPAMDCTAETPPPRTRDREEHTGRALLVDDDQAVATVAGAILTRIGFEVMTLLDSEAALKALEDDPYGFDLLFTDHTMPSITGPELAQAAHRLNRGIAIVITSGYRLAECPTASTEFEQLGKPFSRADVASAVERARARTRAVASKD